MNPSTFLLILVAASAAMAHGHHAANTPAAQFWEQALPGSPMPDAIADGVRKGIHHSPLVEHHGAWPGFIDLTGFDSTASPQMAAETGLFFHEQQLRPGSTMTLSFSEVASPAILPGDVADKVPFANLADVLASFDILAGSAEAAQVKDTLSRCRAPPIAGEVKSCATSLEATVQTAARMLGAGAGGDVVWAAASAVPRAGLPRQAYVVEAVATLEGDRHVGCHAISFPYAVYVCHMRERPTEAYRMTLRGLRGGPTVDMAVVCHLDTDGWNPAHPAFEVLHTQPGGAPVCHFVAPVNLLFGKKTSNA